MADGTVPPLLHLPTTQTTMQHTPKVILGMGIPALPQCRHSEGLRCLTLYADRHSVVFETIEAEATSGPLYELGPLVWSLTARGDPDVFLIKPRVHINRSGEIIQHLRTHMSFEPANLLLIYDDMDLSPGAFRIRPGGGHNSHNGVKTVIDCLESCQIPRIKVGIGRPRPRQTVRTYVLQTPTASEEILMQPLRHVISTAIEVWLHQGLQQALSQFNRKRSK